MRAWLQRILRNVFYDARRADALRRRPLPEFAEDLPSPPWLELGIDDVRQASQALKGHLKLPFQLVCLEGRSYREVADQCQIQPATVATRVYRAKRYIRRRLEQQLSRPSIIANDCHEAQLVRTMT